MSALELYPHQRDALRRLKNGSILWGGVGSGKSRTAVAYYLEKEAPKNVYVITTAKKRDSLDWVGEFARAGVGSAQNGTVSGVLLVDSWNNLGKYRSVEGAFFIFDEQRVVGSGKWATDFIRIAKANAWILLSATPGDTWLDYIPVFVANGFYRNRTDFKLQHVVYDHFSKFPKVSRYVGVGKLIKLRNQVLVEMPYVSRAKRTTRLVSVGHNIQDTIKVVKDRWNPLTEEPIKDSAEYFRVLRKIAYSDESRFLAVRELMLKHPRLIVFYNFDFELAMLRELAEDGVTIAEWNGHRHQEVPKSDRWVYLVQYVAGSEGWNCIDTNAMCFFSMTYSYKNWHQAYGRIDRLNTPFSELFYYVLCSKAMIDQVVMKALKDKKNFNESDYKI